MKAAVERERAAWRRKLAQGRARFQEMLGVVASGQALEKLKVLVDETESEWANPPAVVEASDSLLNDRPEIVVLNQRTTAAAASETSDEPLKLASRERRILTALVQYPEGRSKVQVAVLTGYAANGRGFINYLGGLWSRGMIQGDGGRVHDYRGRNSNARFMGAVVGRFHINRLLVRPVKKGGATDPGNTDPGISRSAD